MSQAGFFCMLGGILLFVAYSYFSVKRSGSLKNMLAAPLSAFQKQVLEAELNYYKCLPPKLKARFEKRVSLFIANKQFISRGDIEIDDEKKTLIAGVAVQLTLGLPTMILEHFDKILLYPHDYYSTIRREYHMGETNGGFGIIVLSWKNFKSGLDDPTDGNNLGLHEMAHALQLENIIDDDEYDFLDKRDLAQWRSLAEQEIAAHKAGKKAYLRPYAFTDRSEFFAVAVEAFFEQPDAFSNQRPEIYQSLVKLLRQDPRDIYSGRMVETQTGFKPAQTA